MVRQRLQTARRRFSTRRASQAGSVRRRLAVEPLEPRLCLSLLVANTEDHEVLRYHQGTGAYLDAFVPASSGGLNKPTGLAYGLDGNLYVSSRDGDSVLRYDGRTGAFVDVFVAAASGGLDGPADLLFGPDGHLYVSSSQNSRVLRYDGSTGAFLDEFVDPGSGGLVNPEGLAFGPDGGFYVSNSVPSEPDSVLRYDGAAGWFVDTFVAAGSGGLDGAADLLFGPDGNLYVASGDTDNVLRYHGTTGALVDAFVAAGSGGLDSPSGLAFGPDGNFYVSNRLGNNVLRYNGGSGTFIDAFATGGGLNGPSYLLFAPADRLEGNGTLATAVPMGAAPGVHLPDMTIHDGTDQDWYRFEVLREDSIDVTLEFVPASGSLGFEVTDGSGTVLATGTPTDAGAEATLTNLPAGIYYLHVWGVSGATNHYGIAIEPAASSSTQVYYVNDGSRYQDYYTLAVGDDANDGLTAGTPKATVQDVLADYDLGPDDLIVIDTGAYGGSTVTIGAEDEGAAYAGAPAGSRFTYWGTRWDLVDADFNLLWGLQFTGGGGTGIALRPEGTNPSTDNELRENVFPGTDTAVSIEGGVRNAVVGNVITGGSSTGVYVTGEAEATLRDNEISDRWAGVQLHGSSTALLQGNRLWSGSYAVYAPSAQSLTALGNRVHGYAQYGFYLGGTAATVRGNEIDGNATGLLSYITNCTAAGNDVHDNAVGLEGYGTFGGSDWSAGQPNEVYNNTTGIATWSDATVRFNRIHHNQVGVRAGSRTDVHHNLVYRNTSRGILTDAADEVLVESNTVYAPLGNAVNVQNGSSNVTLRNNILWAQNGYALYVATDSQRGFASDYNNLYADGSGQLVWWQKPFADLFDWQVEAGFDPQSIGTTVLAPTLDNPLFVNLAADDYHLSSASTSVDSGAVASDRHLEPEPNGDRIDLGAYGNTSEATASPPQYLRVDYPNYYTDWPVDEGRAIIWHTYDVTPLDRKLTGTVKIELYQVGVGKVADIGTAPAADGNLGWSPQASGIAPSTDARYYVQVTWNGNPAINDVSRETFSVPPSGNDYYVNVPGDPDLGDNEYTTAAGDNRRTGKTPGDPKANLLPVLRSYDLDPAETVHIDTGDYLHVRNVVLSGAGGVGDDEGARFTGPTNPARVAHIDRGNPFADATNIELNDGDYVTLQHLTLTGGNLGLWVHNGSTNFHGSDLVVAGNTGDGIRIESDAEASVLTRLTAHHNAGNGVWVATPISTLRDSLAYDNGGSGLSVQIAAGGLVQDNITHDNVGTGLAVRADGAVHIADNSAYHNDTGISLSSSGASTVEDNAVYDNRTGFSVSGSGTAPTVIGHSNLSLQRGNLVYGNTETGIYASGNVLVAGNTVRESATGIVLSNATAAQNVVYDNTTGIEASYWGGWGVTIEGNRVYANSGTGIVARHDAQLRENVVYDNAVGIDAAIGYWWSAFRGRIVNNLVYANATAGLLVSYGSGAALVNNTVYQPAGDALRVEGSSSNISLRNNVLWVEDGYAISVANDSQSGFHSDYNDLVTSGLGRVALWQNVPRATLNDWRNTAFQDINSLNRDPLLVDRDGADNRLGYDQAGAVDYGADDDFHLQSSATDGASPGSCHGGSLAPVLDGGTGLPREQAGTWTVDAASSPLIDRGDAADPFLNEPVPNGGYVNIGAYGNTPQASTSPAAYMLVTRPDGGEVWPAEQTFAVRWRGHDFGGVQSLHFDGVDDYVTMGDPAGNELDLGSTATLEAWVRFAALPSGSLATIFSKDAGPGWTNKWIFGYANNYAGITRGTFLHMTNTTSGSVFLGSNEWTPVVGQWYHLAVVKDGNDYAFYRDGVPDGTASASFAIPDVTADFEVGRAEGAFYLNGELEELRVWDTARSQTEIQDALYSTLTGTETGLVGYWPLDEGAGTTTADGTANHLDGTLGGGTALRQPAWVVSRAPLSLVDVELLQDGSPVLDMATGTPNDGEFRWKIPGTVTPGTNYQVRVTRTDPPNLTDMSDGPFEITEPIHVYYVNDGTVNPSGDWTTAVGDDGNDGLTPATPKASVRAVLEAYDLGANSVIRVDDGDYTLDVPLFITDDDSGVTIEGYHDLAYPDRRALLDRNNPASPVVEFGGADEATVSFLVLTGGSYGVYASSAADSDGLTVSACTLYGLALDGIRIEDGNDDARVEGNVVRGMPQTGIVLNAALGEAVGNEVYTSGTGLAAQLATWGWTAADRILLRGNMVHDNATGIQADGWVRAEQNQVYRQAGTGILVAHGATASDNDVFANVTGIDTDWYSPGIAEGNRVYANSGTGIVTRFDGTIRGNVVYGNSVGIDAAWGYWWSPHTGLLSNNLVYGNTSQGILVSGGRGSRLMNNTVYQEVGDAIRIEGGSANVTLRNNILWVETGADISVADDSQSGFASDYNDLYVTGSGQVAHWQGRDYATREEWFYELDVDEHSRSVDPAFVDADGEDNMLGFDRSLVAGSQQRIDDGEVGFQVTGSWTAGAEGYLDDSLEAAGSLGEKTATWTFTGLPLHGWYELAVTWPARAELAWDAPFSVWEGDVQLATVTWDQRYGPDDFSEAGVSWERLGTFYSATGTLQVRLATGGNYYSYPVVADAVRIQRLVGDRGADDDFRVQSGSLTIDAGDPADVWRSEPVPNGGRVNQGHTGNTAQATTSPAELVQVLAPNGLEKLKQGQSYAIQWQTDGLLPADYYQDLVLSDGPVAYYRLGETAGTVAVDSSVSGLDGTYLDGVTLGVPGVLRGDGDTAAEFDGQDDKVRVEDAAALDLTTAVTFEAWVYPKDAFSDEPVFAKEGPGGLACWFGVYGGRFGLLLSDNGSWWSLDARQSGAIGNERWQHIASTWDGTAWKNYLNGDLVGEGTWSGTLFDSSSPLTIGSNSEWDNTRFAGKIDEPAVYGRALSGAELHAHYLAGLGQGFGTADIVLLDGGVPVEQIADDAPNDGVFSWTVPARLGDDFRIRVTANVGSNQSDVSDQPFLIANDGPDYYVNIAGDANLTDNEYTTAAGDNANSGKRPDEPMSSLLALVAAYDLDPGDVVHVDTGHDDLARTLTLADEDSGVRIEGPTQLGHAALLNRGHASHAVVQLAGADDVTLADLSLTGGRYGVHAVNGGASQRLTVEDCTVFANAETGIFVEYGNDDARLVGNSLSGQSAGISVGAARARVTRNEAYDNTTGIWAGISGVSEADRILVAENRVHDNTTGIWADGFVLAQDNQVYRQAGTGIVVAHGATAAGNDVFANVTGIDTDWYSRGIVERNRVYANTGTGIITRFDGTVRGNTVYGNSVGIDATWGYWWSPHTGLISNNLVYGNTNQGILVSGGNGSRVVNNTLYQELGEAVRVQGGSQNVNLRNNILWVQAGSDISVADDSQSGFASDWNDLYVTGSGNVGHWQGRDYATREEWFYELDVDEHSRSVDPTFVDADGADNSLGFSGAWVTGTRRVIDDEDAGFQLSGEWTELSAGYQDDSWYVAGSAGDKTATWTFTGLEPGGWYEVAVTWPASGSWAWDAEYAVREGEAWVANAVDQQGVPDDFQDGGVGWERLGWFQAVGGMLEVRLSSANYYGYPVVADAVRIQRIEGDHGADDDFRVQTGSLTIDAGDPGDDWRDELLPNGGRVNQGHTGNTAEAATSPAELVQVLAPNGLEKLERGQSYKIQWRTDGLTPANDYRDLVLSHGPVAYYRLGETTGTVAFDSSGNGLDGTYADGVTVGASGALHGDADRAAEFDGVNDTVQVGDNPSLDVTTQFTLEAWINPRTIAGRDRAILSKVGGAGGNYGYQLALGSDARLSVLFNAADESWPAEYVSSEPLDLLNHWHHVVGTYDHETLRLYVDGTLAASRTVGAKTVADSMSALRIGGDDNNYVYFDGRIDEAAVYGRALSGAELRGHYLAGLSQGVGTVDIELLDGGVLVETVADDIPNDIEFTWTVPARLGDDFRIRVTASVGGNPMDVSDQPFQIVNDGPDYYVNIAGDANLTDNEYTTAAGDNANSGKRPDQPMSSLLALVAAYDLHPGDVVHVDAGNYDLARTLTLSAADSGVRIEGPTQLGHAALLDRGYASHAVVQLAGADDVTLADLSLTGGRYGVHAVNGGASQRLTVEDCTVFENAETGIFVEYGNDDARLVGNSLSGQSTGIWVGAARAQVTRNEAYDNTTGIWAGISGVSEADRILVADNLVHDNATGIRTEGSVLAEDNRVYRQTEMGIVLGSDAVVVGNEVFANHSGIYAAGYNAGTVEGNRVYANAGTGITLAGTDGTVRGNVVYCNQLGIYGTLSYWRGPHVGEIINNLVYGNTNQGIVVSNGIGAQVVNNTVYQKVGEAVRVDGNSANVTLRNNILWVEAGYDIYVAGDSQAGFDSQYNLFHQGSDLNAHVGYWGGVIADLLQDWHAVSGQDEFTDDGNDGNDLSRQGYPRFVDIDGADNVLGYAYAESYDGGPDDNFLIAAGSPAIDCADTWAAPPYDITGQPRVDDPDTPNAGSLGYMEGAVLDSVFGPAAVGTAQDWHADEAAWTLTLPFAFPFYGTDYASVQVSSNGLLHFAGSGNPASGANSTTALAANVRIAPLWDDLHTSGAGDDIFVDTSVANQVAIRWDATNKADGGDVDFTVLLFADGRFRFDYGGRPAALTPTVGVSKGDGATYALSAYNGRGDLNSVDSIEWASEYDSQHATAVLNFSSQYGEDAYNAAQTLGPPDTFAYGDFGTAWAPSAMNGTSEFITVGFAIPVYASGATIRETYGNGFVTQVDVLDTSDVLHTVWIGTDPSLPGTPVDFRVHWPRTTYLVKGLKIYTDTDHDLGAWEEIDAIQLHGGPEAIANYAETVLGENHYFAYDDVGVATGWRWDNSYTWLELGFAFPFYGESYTGMYVSDNGLLQFVYSDWPGEPANSVASLAKRVAIAPLWDDLRTDGTDDDIFVDTSTAGQITIRWDATNKADGSDVNFAVTLFATGEFRFDYGPGNDQLTPTVGISRSDGYNVRLSAYDGRSDLTSVTSVRWALEEVGFADLGAYEFRGSSNDLTPPQLTGTVPTVVEAGGNTSAPVTDLTLTFSEALNPIDAAAPANYELRRAVNGVFGDGDDVVYALTPTYVFDPLSGSSTTSLDFGLEGAALPADTYRLTVLGREDAALHDLAGNRLDGDRNGSPGPDYVRTFTVIDTLIVSQFTWIGSGFLAEFNRALELSVLNLYDGAGGALGPADVVVRNSAGSIVAGSIVSDASRQQIRFVTTGSPLAPDVYTVTLRSGAAAFRDPAGRLLDGNRDGVTGDDFTTQFTVPPPPADARLVSLPDMACGAAQGVNIPNAAAGLPIRISNAAGVTSLAVDLMYDPTLLRITGVTLAAGLPGDWSVTLDTGTPGVAKIRAAGTTPLSGLNIDVVRLTAAVPNDAPYGASQAIRLENVALNGGAIAAVGDAAMHKAVYLGDADGSGIHSSADAFLTVQAALGLASGFAAHPWTDPRIVGDADGSGVLSAADAFLIVQEGLGLVEPFVPDNPHIGVTPVGGGVDPQFQIDANIPAGVGGLVTVPVKLAIEPAATNVGALDFDLFFDASRLTIQLPDGISAGADTAGWAVSAMLVSPGHLRVGMVSSSGQPLAVGLREVARLQFHVAASLRDAIPLAERAAFDDALPVSERPGYVALDIEPVDARAGGYTWTDADGSLLIRPTPRTLADATRERIWRDLDARADLLEDVLADLVHDLATDWP